jgi:hypothetical protein
MERLYYSDAWKRLLYTKISFPYEIDEAAGVVSGRRKSGPHLAVEEHPATFSVKTAMPRNGAVVPVLTHNTDE